MIYNSKNHQNIKFQMKQTHFLNPADPPAKKKINKLEKQFILQQMEGAACLPLPSFLAAVSMVTELAHITDANQTTQCMEAALVCSPSPSPAVSSLLCSDLSRRVEEAPETTTCLGVIIPTPLLHPPQARLCYAICTDFFFLIISLKKQTSEMLLNAVGMATDDRTDPWL